MPNNKLSKLKKSISSLDFDVSYSNVSNTQIISPCNHELNGKTEPLIKAKITPK